MLSDLYAFVPPWLPHLVQHCVSFFTDICIWIFELRFHSKDVVTGLQIIPVGGILCWWSSCSLNVEFWKNLLKHNAWYSISLVCISSSTSLIFTHCDMHANTRRPQSCGRATAGPRRCAAHFSFLCESPWTQKTRQGESNQWLPADVCLSASPGDTAVVCVNLQMAVNSSLTVYFIIQFVCLATKVQTHGDLYYTPSHIFFCASVSNVVSETASAWVCFTHQTMIKEETAAVVLLSTFAYWWYFHSWMLLHISWLNFSLAQSLRVRETALVQGLLKIKKIPFKKYFPGTQSFMYEWIYLLLIYLALFKRQSTNNYI